MATCLRSGLKTSLPHLRRTTTTPLAAQALTQCQRRTKYTSYAETGGREGTGKIGYDKFKQVDRREHKMPTQQSMKVSQKIQMRKNMPNDLGLLLGTLVMPSNMPSLTSEPQRRLRMEVQRVVKRFKDLVTVVSYKWTQTPRLKIHFFKTAATAQALHRQMYTALADGDTHTLSALACEGLNSNLSSRISSRPKHSTYSWTLHRYIGTPRVVSQRAAILPIDDGTGHKTAVRQCVVRIKSVQSLRRTDARATIEEAAGKEQEVLEYVVVQRRVWKGIEERWKLWGTTTETRLEDWEKTMNPEIEEEGKVQEASPEQKVDLDIASSRAAT